MPIYFQDPAVVMQRDKARKDQQLRDIINMFIASKQNQQKQEQQTWQRQMSERQLAGTEQGRQAQQQYYGALERNMAATQRQRATEAKNKVTQQEKVNQLNRDQLEGLNKARDAQAKYQKAMLDQSKLRTWLAGQGKAPTVAQTRTTSKNIIAPAKEMISSELKEVNATLKPAEGRGDSAIKGSPIRIAFERKKVLEQQLLQLRKMQMRSAAGQPLTDDDLTYLNNIIEPPQKSQGPGFFTKAMSPALSDSVVKKQPGLPSDVIDWSKKRKVSPGLGAILFGMYNELLRK